MLSGLALGILALVVVALVQVGNLTDRGSGEVRSFRRQSDRLRVAVQRAESAGAAVVDLGARAENMRSALPRAAWKLTVSPAATAGLLWLGTPLPTAMIAGVAAGLFLLLTLPDDYKVAFHGFMSRDGNRPGRDQMLYIVGGAIKWAQIGAAMWAFFAAAGTLAALRLLPTVGWLALSLLLGLSSHLLPRLIVQAGILRHRTDDELMLVDESVLFLRSFEDDRLRIWAKTGVGGLAGRLFPAARLRFEAVLGQAMARSPVVAIGRPGEVLRPFGAVRTYWADDEWQDAIRRSANRLRKVVLVAGESSGLAWELEQTREWGLLGKTLIVLPPGDPATTNARLARLEEVLEIRILPETVLDRSTVVGLSLDEEARVTYHLASGRDWAAYMVMIGQSVAGDSAATASGTRPGGDVSPAGTLFHGSAVDPSRSALPLHSIEPVPHSKMIRLLNATDHIRKCTEKSRELDPALHRMRKAIRALGDEADFAGTRAYYGALAAVLPVTRLGDDDLDPHEMTIVRNGQRELRECLTLARKAQRRVTQNVDLTTTPDEIELDILEYLALTHELLDEADARIGVLRTAVEVSAHIPELIREVTVRRELARALREGQPDLALEELARSIDLARRLSQSHVTGGLLQERAAVHAAGGDFGAAAESQMAAVRHLTGVIAAPALHDAELLAVDHLWRASRRAEAVAMLRELTHREPTEEDSGLALAAITQALGFREEGAATSVREPVATLLREIGMTVPREGELPFNSDALVVMVRARQPSGPGERQLLAASLDALPEVGEPLQEWLRHRGALEPDFWWRINPTAGERSWADFGLAVPIADVLRQRAGDHVVAPHHLLAASLLTVDFHQRRSLLEPKLEALALRSMANDLLDLAPEEFSQS